MHTPWPIRRKVIARRDGARCGEAAYPCLLPWALDHAAGLFSRLRNEMEESGVHTYQPGPWHAGLEPFPDDVA